MTAAAIVAYMLRSKGALIAIGGGILAGIALNIVIQKVRGS